MECNVCGGQEFNVVFGKQMCAECGTETEKFVQIEVNDVVFTDSDLRHRMIKVSEDTPGAATKELNSSKDVASSTWTTYEAYTLILQDWSHALVKLGASTSLPVLVLRLWAAYLNKIEIAFVEMKLKKNKLVPKTPKVGLLRNKRNLAYLHQQQLPSIWSSHKSKKRKHVGKVERLLRKAKKRKILGGAKESSGRAKSSIHNLSEILMAAEKDKDGVSSGSSNDCLSESSQGSKRDFDEFNNSIVLKHKPLLRSRFVLMWLNHNDHIHDALDSENRNNPPNILDLSESEENSDASVEEISSNYCPPFLASHRDEMDQQSSQVQTSSSSKVNNTNPNAFNKVNNCVDGSRMKASSSNLKYQGETRTADEPTVTRPTSPPSASNFYGLYGELDALFKEEFNKPKKLDRRRRERMVSKPDLRKYKEFEPYEPTLPKLLALVYIACRVNGEELLLLDMLNWCSANHIPYVSAPYLLEESIMTLSRYDLYLLKQCRKVPSHEEVYHHVGRLALLLDAQELPLPRLEVVTSRLLHILCLPENMEKGVVALAKPCMQAHAEEPENLAIHSVETIVAASIVLLIKIQWCLNGSVEDTLSDQVERVNAELKKRGAATTLFCWHSWHLHMNRVLWFNETVEPGSPIHPWQEAPLLTARDASSLTRSFWSDGFWRRSRTTTDRDGTLSTLFQQLMNKSGASLAHLLNEDRLFTATYHHLTGVAQQYRHSWRNDCRADKQDMKEVADTICQTSFERDQDAFLLDIDSLRANLKSCGSSLEVRLASKNAMLREWSQKSVLQNSFWRKGAPKNKKAIADTCEKNSCSFVYQYDESLTGDSPALPFVRSITLPEECSIDGEVEVDDDVSGSDGEDIHSTASEIGFVNPMESYWAVPIVKKKDSLPSSFWWLVKLVAYACQAKPDNLLECVRLVEGYFLGKRRKTKRNTRKRDYYYHAV